MKVAIVGTGAIGGFYGGKLAKAGHDVFFIARGENLTALKSLGLTVKSCDGDFLVSAQYGETGEFFGIADLVVVCIKSFDTENTLELYKSNVGPETKILSLQNGVDNEMIISDRYGDGAVIGGVAFIGSYMGAPGVVCHTSFGHITIGDFSDATSGKTKTIANAFNKAGVACKTTQNIKRTLYAKMVWNVGFNALTAICDSTARTLVESHHMRKIVESAMLEWVRVANKAGVDLTDDMAAKNIEVTLKGGEVISSMLHDMRSGSRMEIESINGKVVELAAKHNIPAPVNVTLTGIISFMNELARPERLAQPEQTPPR